MGTVGSYTNLASFAGTERLVIEDASSDNYSPLITTLVYKAASDSRYKAGAGLDVAGTLTVSSTIAAGSGSFAGDVTISADFRLINNNTFIYGAAPSTGDLTRILGYHSNGNVYAGAVDFSAQLVLNSGGGTVSTGGHLNVTSDLTVGGNYRLAGGVPLATLVSNYVSLFEPAGNSALLLGNATDPTNYYSNTVHAIYNRDRSVRAGYWSTNGLAVGPQSAASDADASRLLVQNADSSEYASGTFTCRRADGAVDATFLNGDGVRRTVGSVLLLSKNTATGRSVSATGTINASGADYAEYMRKAAGCGVIAKGRVCGVNADGEIVTLFAEARSFVVKSTDPSLVGGDAWGADLGERPALPAPPERPKYEGPDAPIAPPELDLAEPVDEPLPKPPGTAPEKPGSEPVEPKRGDEGDAAWAVILATYGQATIDHQRAVADYEAALAAHKQAKADYPAQKATVEARNAERRAAYESAAAEQAKRQNDYVEAKAAYDDAISAHETAWAQIEADHAEALAACATARQAWEADMEQVRAGVDRIAFSGQVPCIVDGDFAVGDYIIAAQDGDGIKAIAVPEAEISFEQYRRRIGKVWAVTEEDPKGRWPAGRAWIDVQHG